MSLKDKLYDYVVRKNPNVRYEYERYVMEHIDEHYTGRTKHWKVLGALTWHYRVKKKTEPMMYWDVEKKEVISCYDSLELKANNQEKNICPIEIYSEYEKEKRGTSYSFAVGLKDYDVVSFDIFDTLILRNINEPTHIFMIVGNKLGIFNFSKWRILAEKEVREKNYLNYGNRECTLEQIYKRVSYWTGIDAEYGANVEFETELDFCMANPYMKQVYQIVKTMKKKIYATSNMYLTKDRMKILLEKCGYDFFDNILISCDYHCSKASGSLFQILKYEAKSKNIVHVGDNRKTDICGAKIAKIDAKYYQACRDKGKEYRSRGFSSLIGAAYYATVNNCLHNGTSPCLDFNELWEFGYVYGGMTALGYVNWIHEKAVKEDKDLVVFLARDGALLKEIYDMVYTDIPSVYLLWSRIAAMKNVQVGTRNQILDRVLEENVNKEKTIKELLDIMGWSDLQEEIYKNGINPEWFLVSENIVQIRDIIVENWDKIERISESTEKNIGEYIEKIIGDKKNIILVDLGWTGKNATILKDVLVMRGMKKENINICLLGSICKMQNPVEILEDDISCYMFDAHYNREIHDTFCRFSTYAINLLEQMFSSSCNSFCGIDKERKFIFASPEIENFDSYHEISRGVLAFCKDYYENYSNYPYMLRISGYDAWVCLRTILNNKERVNHLLGKLVYVSGIDLSDKRAEYKKIIGN